MSENITSRRALLAGAGGIVALGALATAAIAQLAPPFEPSADYREIVRLIGLIKERWAQEDVGKTFDEICQSEKQKEADVELIERRLHSIEERVLAEQTPSLDDMLILAALTLYYSDGGFAPTAPLTSCAHGGDCFESRALNLAAAVFKATGMGGANV